jgi:hypothetical protein
MTPRTTYLILCIAGTLIPNWQFIPWLAANGLDARLFVQELFANPISTFFGLDVILSAVAVACFAWFERRRHGRRWWVPIGATLSVGVSLGLPLLLYFSAGSSTRSSS